MLARPLEGEGQRLALLDCVDLLGEASGMLLDQLCSEATHPHLHVA